MPSVATSAFPAFSYFTHPGKARSQIKQDTFVISTSNSVTMASSSPLSVLRSIDKKSFHAEAERRSAVAEAYSLINRLETPWETLFRHVWIHPTLMAAIETAQDLDLFKKWNAAGATKKTEQELRQLVSCDADLFGET